MVLVNLLKLQLYGTGGVALLQKLWMINRDRSWKSTCLHTAHFFHQREAAVEFEGEKVNYS